MTFKPRGRFSVLGALVVAAVSTGGYFQAQTWFALPDPQTADREGLLRWMVVADLRDEPDEVCRQLVARFQALFNEPSDLPESEVSLASNHIDVVRPNVSHLKKVWFRQAADEYSSLDAAARPDFLDRQIRTAFLWAEVDRQLDAATHDPSSGGLPDAGAYLGRFFDDLARWQAEADAPRRERMAAAVEACVVRWLATYDLAEQTPDLRRQMAERLQREVGDEADVAATVAWLPAGELSRFWANVELLAEAWFVGKAVEYAAGPADTRKPMVAAHLAAIQKLVKQLPQSSGGATEALARVRDWIARAPEDQREAVSRFAGALMAAWWAGGR